MTTKQERVSDRLLQAIKDGYLVSPSHKMQVIEELQQLRALLPKVREAIVLVITDLNILGCTPTEMTHIKQLRRATDLIDATLETGE